MDLNNCRIYDISPLISPEIAVFPGDTTFQTQFLMDLNKGDNLTLSSITTTVHLGAHTDAPSHYHSSGKPMEQRELKYYLGPAQVVSVKCKPNNRIGVHDIDLNILTCPRILFKTGSFPNPNKWNSDFMAFSPELIDALAQKGVILVGIDTPSVDLANDKELVSHQRIFHHDMAILEGVCLDQVSDGVYNLIALPLKIKGADASPVRAILVR